MNRNWIFAELKRLNLGFSS